MPPTDRSVLGQFWYGFSFPAYAVLWIVRHPGSWKHIATPIAMLTAGIVWAAYMAYQWAGPLLARCIPPPAADAALGLAAPSWTVLWGLTFLLLFTCTSVIVWVVSGIIASPFYEMLSEYVERDVRNITTPPSSWSKIFGDALMSVRHSIAAVTLSAAVFCPLAMINIIPLIGEFISFVGGISASAFFVAREVMDIPLSRRRMLFRQKLRLLWRHLPITEGLGFATMCMMWVPLMNFVSMPVAVVAATLLLCDLDTYDLANPEA